MPLRVNGRGSSTEARHEGLLKDREEPSFSAIMVSILGSALSGIASGEASASTAASQLTRVSEPSAGNADIATDFVTLSLGAAQVGIGAKLAETSEETTKALLNIVA